MKPFFSRRGWTIYVSDAVERERSGWSMHPDLFLGEPLFLTIENLFERFGSGARAGSWSDDPTQRRVLPGNQVPTDTES